MQFKKRCVTVYRDFPEGCGVSSRRISSNADDEFLKQSVFQAHGYFPDIKEAGSSDPWETKTSRIDGLDNSREDGLILKSNGGVKYHQEEEGIGERSEHKQKNTSWVKNKALSSHNSTSFTQKKEKNWSCDRCYGYLKEKYCFGTLS